MIVNCQGLHVSTPYTPVLWVHNLTENHIAKQYFFSLKIIVVNLQTFSPSTAVLKHVAFSLWLSTTQIWTSPALTSSTPTMDNEKPALKISTMKALSLVPLHLWFLSETVSSELAKGNKDTNVYHGLKDILEVCCSVVSLIFPWLHIETNRLIFQLSIWSRHLEVGWVHNFLPFHS